MFEIGNTLSDARRRLGLSLGECEAETKIRSKYLLALEGEYFELLPEPAYVRSFLRTYARFLGVDEDLVVSEYDHRVDPEAQQSEHDLQPLPPPFTGPGRSLRARLAAPRRPSRRGQVAWLLIGGAGAVAVLVWAGLGGDDGPPPLSPRAPATAPAAPLPTTSAPRRTAPPAQSGVALGITGTGSGSWVEVRRGGPAGPVLYSDTLAVGDRQSFRGAERLWMRVGWTPGVSARVNGTATPLAEGDGTEDFYVTPKGARRTT